MSKRNATISFADLFEGDGKETWIDGALHRKDLPPGASEWTSDSRREYAGLLFVCPCGCGIVGSLTIRDAVATERPSWEWDGNVEKPTLSPSIQKTSSCRWHGYLRAGVFEEC